MPILKCYNKMDSKKSVEELEIYQLIFTLLGKGCFVSNLSKVDLIKKRREQFHSQLEEDLEFYKSLEVTVDEMIELIKKKY